jgi:hypothetical protein
MVSFKSAVIALICVVAPTVYAADSIRARRLSYPLIAGYEPQNLVTDHNALDLDVAAMETQLKKGAWSEAHHIYKDGAYSKMYADFEFAEPLQKAVPADTKVEGKAEGGGTAKGRTIYAASANDTSLQVQYNVHDVQDSYVDCQVGALWRTHEANLNGCFKEGNGTLKIEGVGKFNYTYDIRRDNKAGRTLAILSKTAEQDMLKCAGCPDATFEKFYEYYGQPDYGHQWVTAAFDGTATSLKNGNVDFTKANNISRIEGVQKGVVNLNIWMAVIRKMNDAVYACETNPSKPRTMDWDEAVAFYTGSKEGSDGKGQGALLHQLADERCKNFNTCGADGNEVTGTSKVNHEIFQQLKLGQRNLLAGNCAEVRANKELIESRMLIPMIQGTLRYAHIQSNPSTASEKTAAEGAAFAAAILPMVHSCNTQDAELIYENVKMGAPSTNFQHVKNAFQKTYSCMQVTCEDVGGYYDAANSEYFEGAAPCTGSEKGNALGIAFGVIITVVAVVVAGLFVVRRRRRAAVRAPPKKNPIFVHSEEFEDIDVRDLT